MTAASARAVEAAETAAAETAWAALAEREAGWEAEASHQALAQAAGVTVTFVVGVSHDVLRSVVDS
jgi:hypothetical protein